MTSRRMPASLRALVTALVASVVAVAAFAAPAAAQTISSAANQTFVVGQAATANSAITITEDASPLITATNDIRIRIPAAFNMTWNTAITTATITGSDAAKVSTTVTYENAGKVLRINVTTTFAANDQIIISGLQFNTFTAASAASNLQLVISGSAGGATVATDGRTKTIVAPAFTEAANQVFTVGNPATGMSTATVTDAATPTITTANDIRLRIPASLNMIWNTAVTTATIGGGAAAKVSTAVTYEDAGKTLVLNVTSAFAASDQITVSGPQFNTFTAVSAAARLQLVVSGTGGGTAVTSNRTKQIVQPTIVSAANQTFSVGEAALNMSTITITDNATSPSITAANDIRVRIPAGFNMTWNTALTTATIGGGSAAKVSTTVSYEDAGHTLVLNVTSNFAVNNQITVSGLQFSNFTAVSAATNLALVVSGAGGGTANSDTRTIQVYPALAISSAANQVFVAGSAATAMSAITITEDGTPSITAANKLRIRIPAGFNMTWNSAIGSATITGSASGKISTTATYESGNQVLFLNVLTSFAIGDQITISGLQFNNFTAASAADNLELVVSGAPAGPTAATDDKTKTVIAPTLSSAANQTFTVGAAATAAATATVTEHPTQATITTVNDIRIRVPAGFNMTWNTGLTTATLSGSAAGKVSTTVTYESAGQVLLLNVTTNFVAGDQIVVSGLQFTAFTAASAANNLQLVISGAGGITAALDDKTKTIVAPSFTEAAGQLFSIGNGSTAMSTATITDAGTSAAITAAGDIRLRIPAALNMTWNTALTTATIGGAAAGKVSTTVSYEDANKTLVLNVTSNFAPSDQITVSGLAFNNFTAVSAATALQLVVSGTGGGTAATSNNTKQIYAQLSISSAANQMFNVGMGIHTISTITVRGDASTQINTANDIRIRIPAGLSMTWNTADVTATIGGAAAAKVSTTVSYEDAGKTLVLAVVTNFAPGDQITVGGLQYDNFTAISAADNLELATGGAGSSTAATDDKTVSIIAAFGISSAANQTFGVGQPAIAMSAITVTDSATTPRITAGNNLRIRIPPGFNMTWNAALTTATLSGSAAGKVSTTVTYESGNQVLFLNVITTFAAGDQLIVSGLQFNNFTAVSAPAVLEMVVSGAGGPTVATDDATKTIVSYGASVSPGTSTASQLPSNGTNYTALLTVQNTGTATDSYDLLVTRSPGTTVTTVSMTGAGVTQGANPDSARLTGVAASASVQVTVTYSVASVAAGTTDALTMTARSLGDPTKSANGRLDVTVVKPNMTISRGRSPSGAQPPGTEITHTITITNAGTAGASGLVLADSLGNNSDFKIGSVVTNLPVGITVALEYSNDAGASWTYTPVSAGCAAPAGYDGCVNRIRWRLLTSLLPTPPDNTGDVQFISRIR